jgi:hypothetical protein
MPLQGRDAKLKDRYRRRIARPLGERRSFANRQRFLNTSSACDIGGSGVALMNFVPIYLATVGVQRLLAVTPTVLWTKEVVQGLIAGAGTLYTYLKMVALLGAARAAAFPALAPSSVRPR